MSQYFQEPLANQTLVLREQSNNTIALDCRDPSDDVSICLHIVAWYSYPLILRLF
jgi:hypothetical protein